jgi:hypothetical protein
MGDMVIVHCDRGYNIGFVNRELDSNELMKPPPDPRTGHAGHTTDTGFCSFELIISISYFSIRLLIISLII